MLVPQILISQNNPSELIFRDITPAYSPAYVGGYGGMNIDADQVTRIELTLDFGNEMVFELSGAYKQTDQPWTIGSYELPTKNPRPSTNCNGCGQGAVFLYNEGIMEEYPSGCVTVQYKVYTGTEGNYVLQGVNITKFILRIKQEKRLIDAVQKLTIPNPANIYDCVKDQAKVDQHLRWVNISLMKLEMMETETGCDCNCIAGRLKQIDTYLDYALK